MDERQAQIRERAGLEEGRINEDFVEFLKRYGIWILLLFALVGGFSTAKRWYGNYADNKIDKAFTDLEDARAGGDNISPDSLLAVAAEHAGARAVSTIARLDAADAYLSAMRRGVKIGAKIGPEGTLEQAEDTLTPEDRTAYSTKAAEQYQIVADSSSADPAKKLWHINALFGLAAVAETQRDFEKAKVFYQQIEQAASEPGYSSLAAVAKLRFEAMEQLKNVPMPLSKADLPDLAPLPAPALGSAPGSSPATTGFSLPSGGAESTLVPELQLTPAGVGEPVKLTPIDPRDVPVPPATGTVPAGASEPGTTAPAPAPVPTPVPAPAPTPVPVPEPTPVAPK